MLQPGPSISSPFFSLEPVTQTTAEASVRVHESATARSCMFVDRNRNARIDGVIVVGQIGCHTHPYCRNDRADFHQVRHPKDAELLTALFQPTFAQDDLTRLPNFRACARSVDPRLDLVPFTLEAPRPTDGGDPDNSQRLREVSRYRHGRPRAEVESEIEASYGELVGERD